MTPSPIRVWVSSAQGLYVSLDWGIHKNIYIYIYNSIIFCVWKLMQRLMKWKRGGIFPTSNSHQGPCYRFASCLTQLGHNHLGWVSQMIRVERSSATPGPEVFPRHEVKRPGGQGHNMDLAHIVWINLRFGFFHLRRNNNSSLAPSLELTTLPGQRFTLPTTSRRRWGPLVGGLPMGNPWISSTRSTGTKYTPWTWHGVMERAIWLKGQLSKIWRFVLQALPVWLSEHVD